MPEPIRGADLSTLVDAIERGYEAPLDRVTGAAVLVDHLAQTGDRLLDHFVVLARDAGATWAQIGEAIGVTRQAAHQRFASAGPAATIDPSRGFAAFDEGARDAVVASQTLAQQRGHTEITAAHLLLAVLDRAPHAVGDVDVEALRRVAEATVPETAAPTDGLVPFDEATRGVLEEALTSRADDAATVGPGDLVAAMRRLTLVPDVG
jgi:Clp amino terminal domain, pathogenicity island component